MIRFRDLVPIVGHLPTGTHNAITDVSGVSVGHVTLSQGDGPLVVGQGPVRTGVTAIVPHPGNIFTHKVTAAVHTINGFGKAAGFEQVRELGTMETPILLTNTLNVGRASDALISYMLRGNPGIGLTTRGTVNPMVGETNDGFLNDIQGRHVREPHVMQALATASTGPVTEGCVGAGTGPQCYQFKGGIGSASRVIAGDPPFTVGALLQTNFGRRDELMMLGVPVGRHLMDSHLPQVGPGSVMIVLATDAPLTSSDLLRLAKRATFGLGRTGTVGHDGSGDFVIAFSTANLQDVNDASRLQDYQRANSLLMDDFYRAVVEAVEESVYNALIAAETTVGRDGNALYALPHAELLDLFRRYSRL